MSAQFEIKNITLPCGHMYTYDTEYQCRNAGCQNTECYLKNFTFSEDFTTIHVPKFDIENCRENCCENICPSPKTLERIIFVVGFLFISFYMIIIPIYVLVMYCLNRENGPLYLLGEIMGIIDLVILFLIAMIFVWKKCCYTIIKLDGLATQSD